MFTSTILFATLATAPAQISNYTIVNQIANPGFESGMSSWSSADSYVDPNWLGNQAAFQDLYGEGTTTYTKRSGSRGYQFGLSPELDNDYAFSVVSQNLSTPVNSDLIMSAQFYAWSQGGTEMQVLIEYTDATPSYYSKFIQGSIYEPQSWYLINFKSALKAGKTVKRISIGTESFPYNHPNAYIDDVMLGKKTPLIIKL